MPTRRRRGDGRAAEQVGDMPQVRDVAALDYTALGTFAFEWRDGRWLLVHNRASRVPQ